MNRFGGYVWAEGTAVKIFLSPNVKYLFLIKLSTNPKHNKKYSQLSMKLVMSY